MSMSLVFYSLNVENLIKSSNNFVCIKNILIMLIISINIFLVISYSTILASQNEWISKYFKVQSERDKLHMLYNELADMQPLIDKYIPISRTNLMGKITYVNGAMCDLTGYTKEELIGKNHNVLRFPAEKEEKYQEMWASITNGKVWQGEIKNKDKSGKAYWVNAYIHPIRDENDNTIAYQALRENVTDKKELEFSSSHDSLTKTYNRKKFDEILHYEIDQYHRYNDPFSLAIFDLDNFKNVNDTYGHQVGDLTLFESVNLIKSVLRESDVLARWGGEEFTLLLPNTNTTQANLVVEKIRQLIQNHNFQSIKGLTISCGLSEITQKDTASSLIERIDKALYKAKDDGRNRVTIY